MAYRQQQVVSKPLLIALVIVAVIGVIMFARTMSSGGEDEKVEGVPPVPADLKAPELPANGPRPTTGG
jgi:hypothetical protein